MSAHWQVRELIPAEYAQWDTLVAQASEGSPYQTPAYLSALAEAADADWRLVGVFREGQLCGGIGLYEEARRLGVRSSSRLLLYYNGPVVRSFECQRPAQLEKLRRDVLAQLADYLQQAPYRLIRVKTRAEHLDYRSWLERGWTAQPVYTYVVDISNLEQTWDNMDQNLRRLVHRAEDQQVEVTEQGDFSAFYALHQQVHARKGAPLYLPEQRFRRFVQQLIERDMARLFQAHLPDGRPIASQLVIFSQHCVTHTLAAAGDVERQHTGCNALLRWRVFQWLSARGYRANDLTDAHQPQVARFKSQLGAHVEMGLQLERRPMVWPRLGRGLKRIGRTLAAPAYWLWHF